MQNDNYLLRLIVPLNITLKVLLILVSAWCTAPIARCVDISCRREDRQQVGIWGQSGPVRIPGAKYMLMSLNVLISGGSRIRRIRGCLWL